MKNYFLLNIFCLCSLFSSAQIGFNKLYDFEPDFENYIFLDALSDHDTIVALGVGKAHPDSTQIIHFVKLDTTGRVLLERSHALPDSVHFPTNLLNSLIKTRDNGYAFIGPFRGYGSTWVTDYFNALMKFNHDGELDFYEPYGYMQSHYLAFGRLHRIIEVKSGYLIGGSGLVGDEHSAAFLIKTDPQGKYEWDRLYWKKNALSSITSIRRIEDNRFALGSEYFYADVDTVGDWDDVWWRRSWLFEVDSLGNVLTEYEGPKFKGSYIYGLQRMPDGWLYTSHEFQNNYRTPGWSYIVRTGEDINDIVWQIFIDNDFITHTSLIDIKTTPDGHYLFSGNAEKEYYNGQQWVHEKGGSLIKFTADGDILWSRLDSIDATPECGKPSTYTGATALSSGSIVACGHINSGCDNDSFPDGRSYGWLLKIGKDGCVDHPCFSAVEPDPNSSGVTEVFPNPTRSIITVDGCDACELSVYDLTGRKLVSKSYLSPSRSFDLSMLSEGCYLVRLKDRDGIIHTKKVIVFH